MLGVEARSRRSNGSHHHHHGHHHHQHAPTSPAHAHAAAFLKGIPLAIDPGVPPAPLFPFVSFADALRAWAVAGGAGATIAGRDQEDAYWSQLKHQAGVAFLSNIPMGTETADQRPQPVISMPLSHFRSATGQQTQTSGDVRNHLHGVDATNSLPPGAPQFDHLYSSGSSVPSGSASLLHPSSLLSAVPLRATSGAATPIQGELLIVPAAIAPAPSRTPPPLLADSTLPPQLLPLRIQTPPPLMGLGLSAGPPSSAVDPLSGAPAAQAVGAHIFHNPLMFPSTLATPNELTRSTTQAAAHAHAAAFLPAIGLSRANTEFSGSTTASGLFFPGQMQTPFGAAQNQSHAQEESVTLAHAQTQLHQAQSQSADDARALNADRGGANADQHGDHTPDADQVAPYSSGDHRAVRIPFRSSGSSDHLPGTQTGAHAHAHTPHLALVHQSSKHVRADGTGQGLLDHEALFVTAPTGGSSTEEWEHQLVARGMIDPRNRIVFTSGNAGGLVTGAPVMVSSIDAWLARDHSSADSSTSGTPHLAGKSRSGSFSLDPLPPMGLDQGGMMQLQPATGGKNALLSIAAAAAAAHTAEEDRDEDEYGRLGAIFSRKKGTSYAYLLPSSYAGRRASQKKMKPALERERDRDLNPSDVAAADRDAALHPSQVDTNDAYDPFFLDDPNIKSGKHRVVLNLPGFMSSLISYVRPKALKQELNETFAVRHEEWIHPRMSLSKIRKCKQLLLDIGVELDLEISTVAVSYIYFEKLVLINEVDKPNRKLMAAVCLLLAVKWTEGNTPTNQKSAMQALFVACEKTLGPSKSLILKHEFPVYAMLHFNLAVKTEHVMHHFRQCLSKLDTVPQEYLGIEWSL